MANDTATSNRVVTCGMCGAHCLASKATEYEYEAPAEPKYENAVNVTAGQLEIHKRLACPRCWRGIMEHSADTDGSHRPVSA